MMSRILITALTFTLSPFSVQAQYFVAPGGDDNNACTSILNPCATGQGAVDKIPMAGRANVVFQPGVYEGMINNYYYRVLYLYGSFNPDGTCNMGAVTLKRSSPGPILFAQDHAISVYNCLTLGDGTDGVGAIASRQYAITDYSNIRFNQTTASHVVAGDSSKINCGGFNEINGGAIVHAQASDLSFLLLRCEMHVTIDGAFNFAAMLQSGGKSIIDASMAYFSGGNIKGLKYIAHDSTIRLPMNPDVPGTSFITGDGAVVERSGRPALRGFPQ
jgi:hypothetical protein